MVLTDKDLAEIEDYFNDTLAEIDKNAFDNRLKTDAAFKKAVMSYQATLSVLNTVRTGKQKTFLKEIEATMPPFQLEKPIRRFQTTWWAMAAVGLGLISVCIWVLSRDNEGGVKLKSPIAQHFEAYPTLNRTKGVEQKDAKTAAFDAYNAQKYQPAAALFEKAFTEKTDTMLLFYKGIAELGNGEAVKAANDLEKLENSNSVPQQAVYFYLGLAAAENKNTEKAINYLKKAADTEGSFQTPAKNALSVLEMKK